MLTTNSTTKPSLSLPKLYKRTSSGAVQEWSIEAYSFGNLGKIGIIRVNHGQVGGAIQESVEEVTRGKNIGRSNETNPVQQACLEAQSKWNKKKEREGYVESLERAQAGETDQEGGIAPMLAKAWEDVKKRFKFPADAQRKLDGVRCISVIQDGKVTLWSRKRAPIYGVPHVVAALEAMDWGPGRIVLDGELFKLGLGFQRITSFVRKQGELKPGYEQLEYHVYDVPEMSTGVVDRIEKLTWEERRIVLSDIPQNDVVKIVQTFLVENFAEAKALHDLWVQEGYEGLMLRSHGGVYRPGARSSDLIKVKEFLTEEFKIIGVHEGRGKFAGLAMLECVTSEGAQFDCCAPGTLPERAEILKQGDKLIGQMLSVKFFEWTDDKLPRFPTGAGIRWEKD